MFVQFTRVLFNTYNSKSTLPKLIVECGQSQNQVGKSKMKGELDMSVVLSLFSRQLIFIFRVQGYILTMCIPAWNILCLYIFSWYQLQGYRPYSWPVKCHHFTQTLQSRVLLTIVQKESKQEKQVRRKRWGSQAKSRTSSSFLLLIPRSLLGFRPRTKNGTEVPEDKEV